jgi:hypothetical protein
MKPKTISEYAEDMLKYRNSPGTLVNIKMELSANLAFLIDTKYKSVKLLKANFWNMKENNCDVKDGVVTVLSKREKPLSDTMVDALWKITQGGMDEIRLDMTTRAYKVLIEAITTSITWSQSQAKMER